MRCTRLVGPVVALSILAVASAGVSQDFSTTPPVFGGGSPFFIFNGQNLDGWDTRKVNPGHVRVVNSLLQLEGDSGWLLIPTDAPLDFSLRFEARVTKRRTCGGVLFHALVQGGSSAAYQLRLADSDGRGGTLWLESHGRVDPFTRSGPTLKVSSEWRSYDLEVRGTVVKLAVDGQQLFNVSGLVHNMGRLGFFVTNGKMEFANIRVERLEDQSRRLSFPNVPRPGNGVSVPMPLNDVKPTYTADALQVRAEGEVWLDCVVLPDGTVSDVAVVRSLYPSLDAQAIAAAKQWQFKPATRNGEPVPVVVMLSMTFRLKF